MSLIVHPAPRIRNEPSANLVHRIVNESSSGVVVVVTAAAAAVAVAVVVVVALLAAEISSGVYAKAVDHRHGWRSNIVPMGLSSRANRAYGWSDVGM